jgi:hypothetical protein
MGMTIAGVQNLLELYLAGHLKNKKSVVEFGSQELHLKSKDLEELLSMANVDFDKSDFPDIENWPKQPRTSAKYLYKALGINEYLSLDCNGELDSINHDFNLPFENKEYFSKFDIVTDHCACGHAFNSAEAYRTMHKLCKKDGIIIGILPLWKGNSFYLYDNCFFEGLAAANGYKIIFNSYIVQTSALTKDGSFLDFHIPLNRELLNSFDMTKLKWIGVCAVLQKTSDKEFQFPYQGNYLSQKQSHMGFNRLFFKDPPGYAYVPIFGAGALSGKMLLKELVNRIKIRLGLK